MTTLIPSINRCLGRMTSGERRLARRFESHLEDDYLCWYDVPIGPKQQHPDFVVLHPSRGLLILEVKDWKLDTIQRIDKQSATLLTADGAKEVQNPLEQARQYAYAVIRPMQKDPALIHPAGSRYEGRLAFPFGYGVVLSNITRAQFDANDPGDVLPPHRVICADEMTESVDCEAFQRRLWDMFTTYFNHQLTLPQIDRIRWHLFPEVRITQKSIWEEESDKPQETADAIPDILRVMDLQQEQLARSLGEGHRVIHGSAGAGKTLILVYRCVRLAQALAKPILVLCYNVTLAKRLESLLAEKGLGDDRVQVRNFHKWCSAQLRSYHVPGPDASLMGDDFFEDMVQRVIDGVDREQIPASQYGAVLIDEGHDFQPHWLRLAVQMVDPDTRSLLVLYDDAQSIYERKKFTFSSVGIEARGRTTILKVNYRNTKEILQVAADFARDLLTETQADEDGVPLVAPESAGRTGPPPEIIELPNWREELRLIASRFKELSEAGTPWRDMAVLHLRRKSAGAIARIFDETGVPYEKVTKRNRKAFDTRADTVKILTMHSSKGLEFPVVAIPAVNCMPHEGADATEEARVLYVGMTRAMDNLIITGHENGGFFERLQEAV